MSTIPPPWYTPTSRYHLDDEDGVTVIRYPGGLVKWRSDCAYCEHYASGGSDFFPSHGEASWCRNGRPSTHCTCDSCF